MSQQAASATLDPSAESAATSNPILAKWQRWQRFPGGRWLFSRAIGRMAPYTGTIGARVVELEPGYARLEMRDRPGLRNHLSSLHAVALVNLAEETSGLAMMAGLPATVRGILTGFEIEYLKKARGTITGACRAELPATVAEKTPIELVVDLTDGTGDLVARGHARWQLGERSARGG